MCSDKSAYRLPCPTSIVVKYVNADGRKPFVTFKASTGRNLKNVAKYFRGQSNFRYLTVYGRKEHYGKKMAYIDMNTIELYF